MGAGVTNNGVLDTDATGGGGSTFVAIGQPVNATDAAVLNSNPVGTEYALVVRPIGGSGGGPATIADGADVNAGATTDAAVVTDTNGTLSGKLRGLVKWAFERMPVSLGQKVMTASFPVVIASDQSDLNVISSQTQYKVQLEESSPTITYVGQAPPGTANAAAAWQIKRLDSTSGLIVTWADSVSTFTKVWNDRATYTYN